MAIMTIRSTYALDPATVRQLEGLAERWGVSKSEALRRAIRVAIQSTEDLPGPLQALDSLQAMMNLDVKAAGAWERAVREERRATGVGRRR